MAKNKIKAKKPKAVSLSTLPTELITTIVEHALPDDIASTYSVHLGPYSPGLLSDRRKPAPPDSNRYAVVYVDRRFNAEAVRMLHARQFRIEINEMSFHEGPEPQAIKHWYDTSGQLTGYEATWDWHMTFPGLDLREIQGPYHFLKLPFFRPLLCGFFLSSGSCSREGK